MHYNHRMQWIMVYMTRYWISTLHKTYSRDYNGLSFPHQFPDASCIDFRDNGVFDHHIPEFGRVRFRVGVFDGIGVVSHLNL